MDVCSLKGDFGFAMLERYMHQKIPPATQSYCQSRFVALLAFPFLWSHTPSWPSSHMPVHADLHVACFAARQLSLGRRSRRTILLELSTAFVGSCEPDRIHLARVSEGGSRRRVSGLQWSLFFDNIVLWLLINSAVDRT
jgi:hypothetical protein